MNWSGLDYLIIAIVVISMVLSFLKGLTRELISLAAAIGGVIAASWLYADVGKWFEPYLKTPELAQLAGFLAILAAALIAGAIVSALVGRLVRAAGLSGADRLLGACFGFLRGSLLSLALLLVMVAFAPGREVANRSRLAPYLVQGSRLLAAAAPRGLQERFWDGFGQARKIWNIRSGGASN